MSIALSITNFTKYYGSFKAVDDLCLEIQEGEFFGLLGPNGAGKSTTIHSITGLANFQQGEIRVMGYDVKDNYKESRSLIGLAPQEVNFDPFLNAEQILFYTGGYYGLTRKRSKERSVELLKQFNLLDSRKLTYKHLSGGMKRRLLIARSLVHEPKILILDEPTAGVDLELRYLLWEHLKELNEQGTTIILTTHYIEEAERLCNRIGIINHGKLIACDEKNALIQKIRKDTLLIQVRDSITEVPKNLQKYDVSIQEDGKHLVFREEKETLNTILKKIQDAKLYIERIEIDPVTLEDVFRDLTITGTRV